MKKDSEQKISHYREKIKQEYPNFSYKKFSAHTDGYDHDVLIFDNKQVFRFVKGGYAKNLKKYKTSLQEEKNLLDHLAKNSNVQLPVIEKIFQDGSFTLNNMVKGKVLKPWRYKKLSVKNKKTFAKQLANFLTLMHTTQIHSSFREPRSTKTLKKEIRTYVFPKLNKREQQKILDFFELLEKHVSTDQYTRRLIHNDLHTGHLLWDEKKNKLGIIDFTDRGVEDAAEDFFALWRYGKKFVELVYSFYRGSKDEQFLERSQLYFQRSSLHVMRDAIKYKLGNFDEGYKKFFR